MGPGGVRDFRFGTRSSPPSASAAASATDGVPTAASGAPDGFGTVIDASRSGAYVTSGTPRRCAAPTIPGSCAFASTVASAEMLSAESPASRRVSSTRPRTSSRGAFLEAPTPTTSDGGRNTASRAPGSTTRSVTRRTASPSAPTFPGSGGSGHTASARSATGSPSSTARVTGATAPSTGHPRVSRPGTSAASVAVVTTGAQPRTSATCAASSFAPPPWPPSRDTAYRCPSSTHTTPGSADLPASSGAISRTTAPVARKHTS